MTVATLRVFTMLHASIRRALSSVSAPQEKQVSVQSIPEFSNRLLSAIKNFGFIPILSENIALKYRSIL